MAPHNHIILFHYDFSPFARRITWYLTLRSIEYAQCLQPVYLPREDLNALGVKYRRIPVMSIGRDIYCDTRLILQKLEERFPDGRLGATQPDGTALEKLLESWTIDGGIFTRSSQIIPLETPLLKDPKFIKDREDYQGRSWALKDIEQMQPEGVTHIRAAFDFLEEDVLGDGRLWVLKTEEPSLADIEAIWPFHWLRGLDGALPPALISAKTHPKVFAWMDRFDSAISIAKDKAPKPVDLKGAEAVRHVTKAEFAEPEGDVDNNDPLKLYKGQEVESWPIDSGFRHRDRGRLVSLSKKEMVLATPSKLAGKEVRIHHPRWNFRINAIGAESAKL